MRIATTAAVLGIAAALLAAPQAAADADGALSDGQVLTAFDVSDPAIGNLNPALLSAIQHATTAAAADGVTMTINSGWRSPQFQQRLLENAIATYGSYAAARQYVETPEASRHVTGNAVDIGPNAAAQWLTTHGARFGLCRIYANEMWHFELATDPWGNCPPLQPNAAG